MAVPPWSMLMGAVQSNTAYEQYAGYDKMYRIANCDTKHVLDMPKHLYSEVQRLNDLRGKGLMSRTEYSERMLYIEHAILEWRLETMQVTQTPRPDKPKITPNKKLLLL